MSNEIKIEGVTYIFNRDLKTIAFDERSIMISLKDGTIYTVKPAAETVLEIERVVATKRKVKNEIR